MRSQISSIHLATNLEELFQHGLYESHGTLSGFQVPQFINIDKKAYSPLSYWLCSVLTVVILALLILQTT
mgnify:CR=1 FL=1